MNETTSINSIYKFYLS